MTDAIDSKNVPALWDVDFDESLIEAPETLPAAISGRKKGYSEVKNDYARVVMYLKDDWRIIECRSSIQWIFQRRSGGGWVSKSFCRSRQGLIRAINGISIWPRTLAIAAIGTLPEWFVSRFAHSDFNRASLPEQAIWENSYDAGHSIPLKMELSLSEPFAGLIREMADAVFEHSHRKPRKDAYAGIETALAVVLGNLLRAFQRDPLLFVRIPMGNGDYLKQPGNPTRLGIRAVREAVNFLIDHNPTLVEKCGGNGDSRTGRGFHTRLRGNRELIRGLESSLASRDHIEEGPATNLLEYTHSWSTRSLFKTAPLPLLRIKPPKTDEHDGLFLPVPEQAYF